MRGVLACELHGSAVLFTVCAVSELVNALLLMWDPRKQCECQAEPEQGECETQGSATPDENHTAERRQQWTCINAAQMRSETRE